MNNVHILNLLCVDSCYSPLPSSSAANIGVITQVHPLQYQWNVARLPCKCGFAENDGEIALNVHEIGEVRHSA